MVQFLVINAKNKKSFIYNNLKNIKHIKFTRTRIIYILLIILIITYLLYVNLKYKPYYYDSYQRLSEYKSNVKFKDKVILLWTDRQRTDWNVNSNGINEKDFTDFNCPQTACIITTNSNYFKTIEMFDGIVFNSETHLQSTIKLSNLMFKRKPEQIFIYYSLKSPAEIKHNSFIDYYFYNWTMTYRLDSDVVLSHGSFIHRLNNKLISDFTIYPVWNNNFYDESLYYKIIKKTKKIAWFDCKSNGEETQSRKYDLIQAIQKYTIIDVCDDCANLSCLNRQRDDKYLENNYKFYLIFENSLCQDFISAQFYEILKLNIIPIVYGGSDYSKFVPPHSYIDVNNFNTVNDLVDYLNYLNNHPLEYMKYFWWKTKYDLVIHKSINGFCELCKKLQAPKLWEKYQSYYNITKWWYENMCYKNLKLKF